MRGRALGNTHNIGDPYDSLQEDIRPLSQGRINVTIVDKPPKAVVIENPTSSLKVMSACYETMGPLLKKVAKSYSPVRSKFFSALKRCKITIILRSQLSCLCA